MSKEPSPTEHRPAIGRRDVLWGVGGAMIATVGAVVTRPNRKERSADKQLEHSDLEEIKRKLEEANRRELGRKKALSFLRAPAWTELDFNAFLDGLSDEGISSLEKALGLAHDGQLRKQQSVARMKRQLLKYSSNVLEYPFLSENNIQYHQLLKWVAKESGVHEEITSSQSTFVIEHALSKKLSAAMWDKLDQQQRMALLKKLDSNGRATDHAALAALSGPAAVAALSATVYFSGFAFYTSMSVVMSTAAASLGVVLPFGAYTGASSLAAFLTGPVGWAIAATVAATGLAMLGRANVKGTVAAVLQIHMLKVAALQGLQSVPDDIFDVVGRVFPK